MSDKSITPDNPPRLLLEDVKLSLSFIIFLLCVLNLFPSFRTPSFSFFLFLLVVLRLFLTVFICIRNGRRHGPLERQAA